MILTPWRRRLAPAPQAPTTLTINVVGPLQQVAAEAEQAIQRRLTHPTSPGAVTFVADCPAGHPATWVEQQFRETTIHCPTCDKEAA